MLLDFLLPSPCILCDKIGKPICNDCLTELKLQRSAIQIGQIPGFCYASYDDKTAKVVNAIKEKGITAAINQLAQLMSTDWPDEFKQAVLVPIPSAKHNQHRRGFSHTLLWTNALARHLKGPRVDPILVSAKPRVDQTGLSPNQRLQNMEDAFKVIRSPKSGPLLLIDDVLTTGATLMAAEQALIAAGVREPGFCVFTRVQSSKPL